MWHVACYILHAALLAINVIVVLSADMISYVKTIRSSPSVSRNWGLYLHHQWLQQLPNCSHCSHWEQWELLSLYLSLRAQAQSSAPHTSKSFARKAFPKRNRYKIRISYSKKLKIFEFSFSYFSVLFSLTARLMFLGLYALKIYICIVYIGYFIILLYSLIC